MKTRESGMPDQEVWQSFFDVEVLLDVMQINSSIEDILDVGFGYGTFLIPASKRVQGRAFGIEYEKTLVEQIKEKQLGNVYVEQRDFIIAGLGDSLYDYVMLFNILHLNDPMALIQAAKKVLKKKGKIGVIHWNYDEKTPRGPSMNIRPKPEMVNDWLKAAGLIVSQQLAVSKYHYGFVAQTI